MKNSTWILFFTALALIGATALLLGRIKGHQQLGRPGVKLGNIPLFDTKTNRVAEITVILPENIPGYFSRPVAVTPTELAMLPKDTTFGKHTYWTTNGAHADVSVVLMGQDRTSLHKPEFCLVGQGWTIDQTETVKLKMQRPYPYELPVMKLTASVRTKDEGGSPRLVRGIYIYWFVADNKLTADHNQRMWSMAKNLLRSGTLERWAYISYFSWCAPGDEEKAFNHLKEFIAKSAPEFQLAAGKPMGAPPPTGMQTAYQANTPPK